VLLVGEAGEHFGCGGRPVRGLEDGLVEQRSRTDPGPLRSYSSPRTEAQRRAGRLRRTRSGRGPAGPPVVQAAADQWHWNGAARTG